MENKIVNVDAHKFVVETLKEVVAAMAEYLLPDGVSKEVALNRIYLATDNAQICALIESGDSGQNDAAAAVEDKVNHPNHYNDHPSGVECIVVTEHMSFNNGNAIKYLWRAGLKSDDEVEDLQKAQWYIQREIGRLQNPVRVIRTEQG